MPTHVILMIAVGVATPRDEVWENIMEHSDAKCKTMSLLLKTLPSKANWTLPSLENHLVFQSKLRRRDSRKSNVKVTSSR